MAEIRLFCDENIPGETIAFLREIGLDVSGVHDMGMSGTPDEEVLAKAIADRRTLLTFNADFSDIRTISRIDHCGIIRLRAKDQTPETLNDLLSRALGEICQIELANVLVTIKMDSIRYRQ